MDKSMREKLAHMKKEYSKKKRKLKKFQRADQARKHVKLKLEELNTRSTGDDDHTVDMTGQSLQSSSVEEVVSAGMKNLGNSNTDEFEPADIQLVRSEHSAETVVSANMHSVETEVSTNMHGVDTVVSANMHGVDTEVSTNMHGVDTVVSANMHGVDTVVSANMHGVDTEVSANMHGADTVVSANIKYMHKPNHCVASKGILGDSRFFARTSAVSDDSEDLFVSQYGINSASIPGVKDAHHSICSPQQKSTGASDQVQYALTETCSQSLIADSHDESHLSLRNNTGPFQPLLTDSQAPSLQSQTHQPTSSLSSLTYCAKSQPSVNDSNSPPRLLVTGCRSASKPSMTDTHNLSQSQPVTATKNQEMVQDCNQTELLLVESKTSKYKVKNFVSKLGVGLKQKGKTKLKSGEENVSDSVSNWFLGNNAEECNMEQEQAVCNDAQIVNSDVEEKTVVLCSDKGWSSHAVVYERNIAQSNINNVQSNDQEDGIIHKHVLRNDHGMSLDVNNIRNAFQDINIDVEPDRNISVGVKNGKLKICDTFLRSTESSQSSPSLFSQDSVTDDCNNLENTNIRRRSRSRKRKSFGMERRRSSPRIAELSSQESMSQSSEYHQRVFPSDTDLKRPTKHNSLIVSSLFQCLVDEVKRDKTVVEFNIPGDYSETKGTIEQTIEICDSHISDITLANPTDKCQEICQCETVTEACIHHANTANSVCNDEQNYKDTEVSDVVEGSFSGNSNSVSNGCDKQKGIECKLETGDNTVLKLEEDNLPAGLKSVPLDGERYQDCQLTNVIEISDSLNQSIHSNNTETMSPTLFESPDSHICSKFDFHVKQDMSPGCCMKMVGRAQGGEDADKQGQGKLQIPGKADSSMEAIQLARNSEKEDDGMVLQQIGTFQVVGDQLLCMASTELLVDQERREYVVCLCTGSMKVYTHTAGHWTCVCTHKLINSVRKSSSYSLMLLEDTDAVSVVLQQLRTDSTTLTAYTYRAGHMDTHIIDTIWARSVYVCPLPGYQLITSLSADSRTYLNKYILADGHWSQQTVDNIPDHVSCIVRVRGIHTAIGGLSKHGTLYIWNHEQGCLLCSVDITDVCSTGDMLCPMVCSEQGFIFVPVFPRKRSRDPGSVIVINPQLGTCETLVSLPIPDGTWTGCTQTSLTSDSLLLVRESCGRIHIWDVYMGTLLATLGHVTVTCQTAANHSIALAHKHCVHVYSVQT